MKYYELSINSSLFFPTNNSEMISKRVYLNEGNSTILLGVQNLKPSRTYSSAIQKAFSYMIWEGKWEFIKYGHNPLKRDKNRVIT